ncbi:MAG TPA: N-acyl homoserine lactonase family protein, partial [Thermodesulfobacteriota bacterium]|nr:N-acyl homoserine lactonase family protein [Thermodesulfobacteriota bacterium]
METYTLVPIHLGRINLDLGIMTYRLNYGNRKWLPIISWYVKAGKENILIDSGISSAESAYYTDSPVEDLIDFEGGLKKVAGITPAEVNWVIQTHLHFDHVGNTQRCKNARVVVQKAELEFALAPHPMQGYLYVPNLLHNLRLEVVQGDCEIFPGIRVIHLPSHTPGVQAVSV